jgi:hypothetical protein
MSKTSGLGDNLYVDGYDLSGDIGSLSAISGPRGTLEVTGINKSAMERIYSTKDGAIGFTAYFNPADDQAHPVLSSLPTADAHVMYCRGTSQGNDAAVMVAKQINYDGTRGDDGAFTFAVSTQANSHGIEWGTQLTAGIQTDTEATDSDSIDNGTGTSSGLQAYLQVFDVQDDTLTVTIEDSTDDSTYSSLGAFTAVGDGDRGFERIEVAGTVGQYLRVSTTGSFTSASFAVVVVRN